MRTYGWLVVGLIVGCGGEVMPSVDAGPVPDGRCTSPTACLSGACSRDGRCVAPGTGGRAFAELCAVDSDCASAICDQGICSVRCGDCVTGARCGEDALCRYQLAAPSYEAGPIEVLASGGIPIEVMVPADVGAMVVVIEDDERLRVATRKLTRPDGLVLTDPIDAEPDINPSNGYIGAASLLLPITDDVRARPTPGLWALEVGTYDPANFADLVPMPGRVERVSVIFEPEQEAGGRLDLEIAFAPATGFSARTATGSDEVGAILRQVRAQLLDPLGAELGVVRYRDLDEAQDLVENGDETRSICRNTSRPGPHGVAINVAIVADLAYTGGHAGGIPGPPGIYGTPASCVVIEVLGNGHDTGVLLAHELGHYLGLRHTTEINGGSDPLSDTEECASGTQIVDCPDYRNLMFPAFPTQDGLSLSPAQIAIARRSPWLYERP